LTAFLPSAYPIEDGAQAGENRRQGKMKVLLLENVDMAAANFMKEQGYEVGSWHNHNPLPS